MDTINKLILINMRETEDRLENEFSETNLVKAFSKDEIINGLCILRCLKSEVKAEREFLPRQLTEQSVANVIKAAQTVREFNAGQGSKIDEHDDAVFKL